MRSLVRKAGDKGEEGRRGQPRSPPLCLFLLHDGTSWTMSAPGGLAQADALLSMARRRCDEGEEGKAGTRMETSVALARERLV